MGGEFPVHITMAEPDSIGSERSSAGLRANPRLCERVHRALERVEYRMASTHAEREAIFKLRYAAYLKEGAISPREDGRFADAVDDQPNSIHVGVHVDGELAGAIRIGVTVDGMPPIPTAKVFPDCLEGPIGAGRKFVDPTRFVSDARISREVPELMYLTLRVPWLATAHFGADAMLAAVRPEHYGFYRRLWGNELVSPPRLYPGLAKPVLLSWLDFPAAARRVEEVHTFFEARPGEAAMLFAGCGLPHERLPVGADAPAAGAAR